jgi:acetate kinase
MDRENLSIKEIQRILSKESGLLGISGISEDMRDLEAAIQEGNDRARLAVEAFCYGIKKEIGAFSAALGGLDVIAFAGGIGERGFGVRKRVCEGLEYLGVHLDPQKNAADSKEGLISTTDSTVDVLIVKTDEEKIVATATAEFLQSRENIPS